jgi:hypothetical protein
MAKEKGCYRHARLVLRLWNFALPGRYFSYSTDLQAAVVID